MHCCVDFLGPLSWALHGMHNLMVCMYAFTKNLSLYVIGWPTTETVEVILKKYIPHYSHVKKILSDQNKQFQNKKWHSEMEKCTIQVILISIRGHQGNLAERANKELGRLLFYTYCNTNKSKWPDFLKFFENRISGS